MPRPKGSTTGPTKRTTTVGDWQWNDELFHSKYILEAATGCHLWQGAMTKNGPLFGVAKTNKVRQMTQATRVAYMSKHGVAIEKSALLHTCNNKNCVNPDHLELVPAARHGARGGTFRHFSPRKVNSNYPHQWLLSFNLDAEQNPLNTNFKQAMSQEIAPIDIARHGIDFDFGYSWITITEQHALKLMVKYPEYAAFMKPIYNVKTPTSNNNTSAP